MCTLYPVHYSRHSNSLVTRRILLTDTYSYLGITICKHAHLFLISSKFPAVSTVIERQRKTGPYFST